MSLKLETFFDKATFTLTYVVNDENTKDAIVIDPVLDYDPASSKVSTKSVEKVLSYLSKNELNLRYVLETHAHADHLTGAAEIKKRLPEVKVGIGEKITKVQEVFSEVFNMEGFESTGIQFDTLLKDGETIKAGSIEIKTIATPGHTPACSTYLIGNMAFVGDALFLPDSGTGRCDFPAGSAEDLYYSIHEKLYKLDDETIVYVGHDYQPNNRELKYSTTIGESKKENNQLSDKTSKEEYIKFRNERDSTLKAPRLLLPSIQVNIAAGKLPEPEKNGKSYLKLPIGME